MNEFDIRCFGVWWDDDGCRIGGFPDEFLDSISERRARVAFPFAGKQAAKLVGEFAIDEPVMARSNDDEEWQPTTYLRLDRESDFYPHIVRADNSFGGRRTGQCRRPTPEELAEHFGGES